MKSSLFTVLSRSLIVAALTTIALGVSAQQPGKSIAAEPVQAFSAFNHWVSSVVVVQPELVFSSFENVRLTLSGVAADTLYQPLPVILGLPELPLVGRSAAEAERNWSPTLNYQGLYMQQVVLNAAGTRRELRPMGVPLRAGERFKIRITPTFDSVAEVDQVVGDAWYGRRTGQVYPQVGMSVQIKAGETVDLPIESNGYFLMSRSANERLIMSVHHPLAQDGVRSNQPAYRQDASNGSSYLQLVARGKFPAVEQLVSQAH